MTRHTIWIIFFALVTILYSVANPFLIIITNIVWSHIFEREYVQASAVVVASYILPMLPIILISLSWYLLAKRQYGIALVLLALPALFYLGFLFFEPMLM